jgi:4-hydroxy-4-methyl-2-oxoglutarate aldolase
MRSSAKSPAKPAFALADAADRLRAIPVAEMSDTLTAAGFPDQVLAASLGPVSRPLPFAGPAVCLKGEVSPEAGLTIGDTDAAILPGCIVIVGPGDSCPGALVGGNMITSWRRLGCAGVVVGGFVRDSSAFDGLPALSTGVIPMNNKGRWRFVSVNARMSLPGQTAPVIVRPGDWLHGDADGTVVLPREHLQVLIEDAERVGRIERRMRALILAGSDRQEVYATHDRFGHVRRLG